MCGEKGRLRSLICSMMRQIAYLRGLEMKLIGLQTIIVSSKKSLLSKKPKMGFEDKKEIIG